VSREDLAAVSFALGRTVFCGYRAVTQSLVHDEAFSYEHFVGGGWERIYGHYEANNHVLYSILAKLSISTFGVSEFALRLPSVLAGFFLTLGIYCVLRETVASPWVRWIAAIALGLHPLLLDFSVAARGYGLSLALLVWSIYFFLQTRDMLSGALLGLAISANLTIVFPAAGLFLCPFALRAGDVEKRIQASLRLAFTAIAVFGAICYTTLSHATTSKFYAGTPDIGSAIWSLIETSFHGPDRAGLFGTWEATREIQLFILPVLAIFLLTVSARAFFRDRSLRPSIAPAAMLLASIAGLIAARHLAGLNYPIDRLGLYIVLLFGLTWAIAASELSSNPAQNAPAAAGLSPLNPVGRAVLFALGHRPALAANGALAGLLVLQFVTQIQTRYFQVWPYDLAAKDVARRIVEDTRDRPPDSVKLAVTWFLQPALEFYRQHYRISSLKPIQRYDITPLEGFDFYVLDLKDDHTIQEQRKVNRLDHQFSEPVSGVLLAKEP
jgi:hypothetical protein